LHVWGTGELLQMLIAADLDEYRMLIYPVVLGEGRRLFENGAPPRRLTLVETQCTTKGVVFSTYRSAGMVTPCRSE
jgi:dihydrofolate reductase